MPRFVKSYVHPTTGFQLYDVWEFDDGRTARVWNGPLVEHPRICVYRNEGGIGWHEHTHYLSPRIDESVETILATLETALEAAP